MSWGRRWTTEELNAHIGSKEIAKIAAEKKITPEQSAIDAGERKKFRDHKPSGKHKFCESFLK